MRLKRNGASSSSHSWRLATLLSVAGGLVLFGCIQDYPILTCFGMIAVILINDLYRPRLY